MIGTIFLVLLLSLLIGAVPKWPHSREWGYGPSLVLGMALVVTVGWLTRSV
jgi:hypothetical protein